MRVRAKAVVDFYVDVWLQCAAAAFWIVSSRESSHYTIHTASTDLFVLILDVFFVHFYKVLIECLLFLILLHLVVVL
uniref:At1g56060 n=1 Tax=Arabidopsis thaliana TaxID=3702 RepID=Q6NNN1_ARATH|nr:At1g56060 [Arabidopsis thaliana]AAR92290.1 At1g56060 [Arabidopsis thaliana]